MASLTVAQHTEVASAYEVATARREALDEANLKRESEARTATSDELAAHQLQIESLGFFDRDDFTVNEQNALLDAAGEIRYVDAQIDDAHEVTLMELESDLITAVQVLSLHGYYATLNGQWPLARRDFKLPAEIPQDVRDEYSLTLFSLVQGNLNVTASNLQDIKRLRCLTSDDYNTVAFGVLVLRVARISAVTAIDNYVTLLRAKAEAKAEAEREDNTPGIAGMIWSVIGWDSPTDFLKDMVVMGVTGGASKLVRWGNKLRKAKNGLGRAVRGVDKLLDVRKIERMERRILEIRSAAEKIRKLRAIAQIPAALIAAFKKFEREDERTKVLEQIAGEVTGKYLRGVVSTLAARTATSQDIRAGGALSNEMARLAVMEAIKAWPISQLIDELRDKANFRTIILDGFDAKSLEKFFSWFWLLTAREFLVRWGLATFRRATLSGDVFVNEFIASFGVALGTAIRDLPMVSDESAKWLSNTISSAIRKVLVIMGQALAKELLH